MTYARPPRPVSRSDWNPWDDIEALRHWLDEANGTGQDELILRILKVQEEAGEVAQAVIGMVGQNPRKGVTHTEQDVIGELLDVAITAMVAVDTITQDPVLSRGLMAAKLGAIRARAKASVGERAS